MSIVEETQDIFPFSTPARVLQRSEELLTGPAVPNFLNFGQNVPPLEAVHFAPDYEPVQFAPPTGVYEGDFMRLEWQTMNFRQPFYHRNADVDELSYQINGERTLMTELGSVELRRGDFSRIPRGVAHDNYGREESHLLFYVPAPVTALLPSMKSSVLAIPPFPGWEAAPNNEIITDCLGGPGHEPVAVTAIDEQLLLEQVRNETERIEVLRLEDGRGATTWLYQSKDIMIGQTQSARSDGRSYRRHLDVDEIQYQLDGERILVTDRGVLDLKPGDSVRIPVGVAFSSLHSRASTHISIVSRNAVPQVAPSSQKARLISIDELEAIRKDADLEDVQ